MMTLSRRETHKRRDDERKEEYIIIQFPVLRLIIVSLEH